MTKNNLQTKSRFMDERRVTSGAFGLLGLYLLYMYCCWLELDNSGCRLYNTECDKPTAGGWSGMTESQDVDGVVGS